MKIKSQQKVHIKFTWKFSLMAGYKKAMREQVFTISIKVYNQRLLSNFEEHTPLMVSFYFLSLLCLSPILFLKIFSWLLPPQAVYSPLAKNFQILFCYTSILCR